MADNGQMGPIWLQFPGLSAEELPPDKTPSGVRIIKCQGLTADGFINPHSKSIGFIVLMRQERGVETEMFKQYDRLVLAPFIRAVLENMGIDPDMNNAQAYTRTLVTMDGGMTQLDATVNEDAFGELASLNAIFAKLARNTSSVMQPCDTGDIHMLQRQLMKAMIKQPAPALAVMPHFDEAIQHLCDMNMLNVDAQKFAEMRGMVARSPSVIHQVCTPKKTMESFVRPGWLDRGSLQGPDTIALFSTLKKD